MKIKILRGDRGKWYCNTDNVGKEFGVKEYYEYSLLRFNIKGGYRVDEDDCVITELPESFCVKRCDDNNRDDWNKYLQWLNKQKNYPIPMFGGVDRYKYYGVNGENLHSDYLYPFGTEIHIDDMIKHIDFYSEPMVIESKEEFDMSTNRGRQAYAIKYYPYGTKYRGLDLYGNVLSDIYEVYSEPRDNQYFNIDAGPYWLYIDKLNKWAEIINYEKNKFLDGDGKPFVVGDWYRILDKDGSCKSHRRCYKSPTSDELIFREWTDYCKNYFISNKDLTFKHLSRLVRVSYLEVEEYVSKKEEKMETQKLTRAGLKEIHSVACSNWKGKLEGMGIRNPLENYIELTQEEVDAMFRDATSSQLPIVSKYLKQCNIQDIIKDIDDIQLQTVSKGLVKVRVGGEFDYKSFTLHKDYDWKIQQDGYGFKCLIPTKKK